MRARRGRRAATGRPVPTRSGPRMDPPPMRPGRGAAGTGTGGRRPAGRALAKSRHLTCSLPWTPGTRSRSWRSSSASRPASSRSPRWSWHGKRGEMRAGRRTPLRSRLGRRDGQRMLRSVQSPSLSTRQSSAPQTVIGRRTRVRTRGRLRHGPNRSRRAAHHRWPWTGRPRRPSRRAVVLRDLQQREGSGW